VEPIFEAVLANDPSRITAAAAAQRMEDDLFVAELPHMLYRGDTALHLAVAGLRYDAARALAPADRAGQVRNAVTGRFTRHHWSAPRTSWTRSPRTAPAA
jgi:hypothetical protein